MRPREPRSTRPASCLNNVPYAPVRGRYKVYLIDEVHMFSDSSFNALLKTLEEPPPHVKFLLATTDPQKVPVTVLSRCLQFNLKRLPIEQIQGQLRRLLEAEQIEFEGPALFLLARAADGSMRDGLSLLDQAIAYGGGKVLESDVKTMLGVVSLEALPDLLEAVHAGKGALVLEQIAALAEQAPDFGAVLRDLLTLLHQTALVQTVPEALDPSWGHAERLTAMAQRLTPEDVQLYYQIGLLGRRDLPLAPDPRSGFEMTLLRMLAFRPDDGGGSSADPTRPAKTAPGAAAQPAPAAKSQTKASKDRAQDGLQSSRAAPPEGPDLDDWHGTLEQLGLGGMAAQLASHCTVAVWDGKRLLLHLDPAFKGLIGSRAEQTLAQALRQRVGDHLDIKIEAREPQGETPARRAERDREQRQADAVSALRQDPVVESLSESFDAELLEESVRPTDS